MQIQTQSATVRVGDKVALEELTMEVGTGTSHALVGPSGSGKTTLLNVLSLLQRVTDGRVFIDGRDATAWRDGQRRAFWHRHAALIFQDYGLIEDETVGYNVALSVSSGRAVRSKLRERVEDVLEQVGLADRFADRGSTLSGGEKQRVGFARAMLKSADVIFADEPTASLDAQNRALISRLLFNEAARGATVIVATHDLELAEDCTDMTQVRIG